MPDYIPTVDLHWKWNSPIPSIMQTKLAATYIDGFEAYEYFLKYHEYCVKG